ncbi:MAG: SDR family oxidoreductase [Parvibaculales bacterium]
MKRLEGKKALITAAGQGIGRATAALFAKEGAHVIATDINSEALKGFTQGETVILDATNDKAVKTLAKKIGEIDILFNCVGGVHSGTILDCSLEDWQLYNNLNVSSAFNMVQAFLPLMIKNGSGSIINMSSVSSSIIAAPNRFIYTVTKAAIIGFTKAIAADFITNNIRCNAICPGTIDTPSLQQRLHEGGNYEENKKNFIARQPIGRLGKVEEVAELALYLASDASGFTTGQIHIIDGGWSNH